MAGQVGSDIVCDEVGATGLYVGDVPGGTAAGDYVAIFFVLGRNIASGPLAWSGTAEISASIPSTVITQLYDVWRRLGLDPDNALVNTDSAITSGTLNIQVSRTPTSTTTNRVS